MPQSLKSDLEFDLYHLMTVRLHFQLEGNLKWRVGPRLVSALNRDLDEN